MTRGQFNCHGTGGLGPDAVEQLGPGDEWHAEAGGSQQNASISGIVLHVMNAALYGSDSDGISNEIGLKAGLDDKQSADLAKLRHGKPNVTRMAAFRRFPIKDSG